MTKRGGGEREGSGELVCALCNPRQDTSGLERRAGIPLAEVRASKAGPRGARSRESRDEALAACFGNERRDEEGREWNQNTACAESCKHS
jgi:hypothetical protein